MVKQARAATADEQQPPAHTPYVSQGPNGRGRRRRRSKKKERRGETSPETEASAAKTDSREDVPEGGARESDEPSLRLSCYRCSCLMEYDSGSRFVQCYKCFAINVVQSPESTSQGGEALGLICPSCLTTNLVSSRARLIRCNICSTISAAPACAAATSFSSFSSSSSSSSSSVAPPYPVELLIPAFKSTEGEEHAEKKGASAC